MVRKSFVVITSQRTGSTLLVRSLDSSPFILCAGEIFYSGQGIHRPEFQYRYFARTKVSKLFDLLLQKRRIERHLRWFYDEAAPNVAAIGFKLMVSHARTFPAIVPYLRRTGVLGFFLYRRDTFATALSYYRARVSGLYHTAHGLEVRSLQFVKVDEQEFERLLAVCKADQSAVLKLCDTYGGRLIAYEDMTTNWDDHIAAIGMALEMSDFRVEKMLSKIDSDGEKVQIINEPELRTRFVADSHAR